MEKRLYPFLFRVLLCMLVLLLSFTRSHAQQAGTPDPSFSSGFAALGPVVRAIALQPDGKILVGGSFASYAGASHNGLVRLNPNGTLDAGFSSGAATQGLLVSLAVQPDGKILVGGQFLSSAGQLVHLLRLNPDGSPDPGFNPGSGPDVLVSSIVLQPDGKILIGGGFGNYNGTSRNRIARLNPDGSLDTSFNPGTGADGPVQSIAVQPDGKVIAGGEFQNVNGMSRNYLVRLNPDGSVDSGFTAPGTGLNGPVNSVALQPDGKILLGGYFSNYNGVSRKAVARLNANASLDTSFNPGTGTSGITELALQPDGKVLIGGMYQGFNGTSQSYFGRLTSAGAIDPDFALGTGADGSVMAIVLQPDGHILLGGVFSEYNGTQIPKVARIFGDSPLSVPDPEPAYFSLFPNPSTGLLMLDLSRLSTPEPVLVEVHNLLGQTVQRSTIAAGAATELNLQGLPEGAYLVRVNLAGKVLTQKVLLQR